MTQRTVIVGGGLAGLAAAVALAERGVPATVLESRPRLGGRASSFVDHTTGAQIDNCQHVSLGCCTNFQHFCRTVGLEDLFRTETELFFIGPDGCVNQLSAGRWPPPFHFLRSFASLSYLAAGDRARIALGLRALAREAQNGAPSSAFSQWLSRHAQTPAAVERFWTPVLVSALSETLDRIDVASARKVFVDAFLANREGWRIRIPTVPLDALYGSRLVGWLAERGATVRLGAGIEQIAVENELATGAVLRSGEIISGEHFIVAVPHWLLLELLPEVFRNCAELARIRDLQTAPISSVHLWFDRPVLFPKEESSPGGVSSDELPHAVLIGRQSQWVFNRHLLQSRGAAERSAQFEGAANRAIEQGYSYQVVISASRNVLESTSQDVLSTTLSELADIFPRVRDATLIHGRLVTEHRAVFSTRPGAEAFRPPQQSPIANLQFAGDWTRTGWPATMEGAVRSGYLAAENVLTQLDRPERIVQPDLPVARLSRWLLGIRGCRLPGGTSVSEKR